MLLSEQVVALLQALGLVTAQSKPTHTPSLVDSLPAPIDDIVDGLVDGVDGVLPGLGLPKLTDLPILGSILEAEEPNAGNGGTTKFLQVANAAASDSCYVELYDPPPVLSQTFPPFDQAKATIFRYRQQQSVNLGSWFVHEQWMTPSLFTCADGPQTAEIDIARGWGNTTASRALLERHWDTFVNQSDFEYLASIGINTVRLPIGYWSLGPLYCEGTPFEAVSDVYTNSWSRVVRAINWAGEAGIGVLVDLHGAPGSQNGQPHSGISDGQVNFFNSTNMENTVQMLVFLTQQLASVTNVVGIEILNEPNNDDSLTGFYDRAIAEMRKVSSEAASLPIYIHDAFNMDQYSNYVSNRTDFVVEDHHSYFVFTPDDQARNASQDANLVQTSVMNQIASSDQVAHNLVVGEWSGALVPESLANMTDPMLARQQFCEAQMQAYGNASSGWHYWSYMKEDCETDLDWCFKNAVGKTLPSSFHSYGASPDTSPSEANSFARAVSQMELPPMTEILDRAGTSHSDSEELDSSTPTDSDSSSAPSNYKAKRSRGIKQHGRALSHRFIEIHNHRSKLSRSVSSWHKRDDGNSTDSASTTSGSGPTNMTQMEVSITKGYSDGFLTAKIFAQNGPSKLGFKEQYIRDTIAKRGPDEIASGSEDYYRAWFYHGLEDAQSTINSAMNA